MRVLHVSAVAERGGLEVVLLNILRCLDRSRFEPEVLLLEDGPLVKEIQETGTQTHVIEAGRVREVWKGRKAVAGTVKLIRSRGIALVHSHNPTAHIYGGLAAAVAGVPALFHLHGVPRFSFTREGMISLLSVLVPAQRTLACSAYVRQTFQRAWHSSRHIRVLHNGVIPQLLSTAGRSAVRDEFAIRNDALLVVMVTRLQHWKGVHVFLDAAALVARQIPQVRFLVVGGTHIGLEETYAASLRLQVEQLKLADSVQFAGSRSDVSAFYAAADLAVHCSIDAEPFGMVVVEAMACYKAVVASDAGGPREIVEDGVTGLLVPPNDAEQLAGAILELLADPERRTRMGMAGAERARGHFTARHMVAELESIYEGLIRHPGDSAASSERRFDG